MANKKVTDEKMPNTIHVDGDKIIVYKLQEIEQLPDLRKALLAYGLDPDRVARFIAENVEMSRDLADLRKDSIPQHEFYLQHLQVNEAEILGLLLQKK